MKKLFVIFSIFSIMSLHATEISLYPGESVDIHVAGCLEYQKQDLIVNQSSKVTAICRPTLCQVEHKNGKTFEVYQYQDQQCKWTGCSNEAKLVGLFNIDDFSFSSMLKLERIKNGMKNFLVDTNKCGELRYFVSGVYRAGEGFYNIKR